MTSHRIGVNLRVSGNCDQGARKYMEDNHVIKFLKKDTDDYEFAYFGIFDGHGGPDASAFCRDNLLNEITKYEGFWSDNDELVLSSIRKGFIDTHSAMWNVLESWPKTLTGLPSTSGSTATIAIVKQGKLYTGHCGDSGLVLGESDIYGSHKFQVQAICLTKDHKPDDPQERSRIENAGGEVINKSGVPRVVWSRPKTNHKGPVRRSTQIDQIPFLAVARSLGDLWSYDYYSKAYIVSPEPDVSVVQLDADKHKCLILASDGLWNMLTPEESVNMVIDLEDQFEQRVVTDPTVSVTFWSNPAERLVARALNKWRSKALKADNTSCVVVLIDPLGPSKLTLLKRKRQELLSGGEIINPQLHKLPPLCAPSEIDYRSKSSSNQNANCSLSDTHIRVTDDSMIQPPRHNMFSNPIPDNHPDDDADPYHSLRKLVDDYEDKMDRKGEMSSMIKALKEAIKRTDGEAMKRTEEEPHLSEDVHTLRHSTYPVRKDGVGSSHAFHEKPPPESFTKLSNKHPGQSSLSCGKYAVGERSRQRWANVEEGGGQDEGSIIEVEPEVDVCDVEEPEIPIPPPCTPIAPSEEMDVENEIECDKSSSLHSSGNVTDMAFSLASDESLGSPEPSSKLHRPPTPNSAPAKLTSGRRVHLKPFAKRQLTTSTRKPSGKNSKHPPPKPSTSQVLPPPTSQGVSISSALPPPAPKSSATYSKKSVSVSTSPSMKRSAQKCAASSHPSPDLVSPPKRVLNTSRSMNDVITPKVSRNDTCRSISCTGLTPDMDMLTVEKSKKTNLSTTLDRSVTRQLISTIMAEDKHNFRAAGGRTLRSDHHHHNASVILEDSEYPLPSSDPLKQLNKSGHIRKTGSKRFSNFLKASKIGLDHMFRKNKQSASTGKLEVGTKDPEVHASTKNTSMSTSKLSDMMHARLPDITISHFADITLDASTLTAGDLTNLSALSAEDSMLSAADLEKGHHSLIEEGMDGKKAKQRKGFLQKTRFTLRRARKAAKKAFLPENHRPSGTKRKSDEFLPTPELKRRKQLLADKV